MLPDLNLRQDFYVVADKGGAANYLPPFSLVGADLAMKMGAQYVMPDTCLTSDEQLVVLPDCKVHRDYTNIMDTGLWEQDKCDPDWCAPWTFKLKDLQKIKLRQPQGFGRSAEYDDLFFIPTLSQYLELVKNHNELPSYEKVGVMLKLSTYRMTDREKELFVHLNYKSIEDVFGGEIVNIPDIPGLSNSEKVQPVVIVSEDEKVLKLMRQITNLPQVWFDTSLVFHSLDYIMDQIFLMNSEHHTIQGYAPSASLLFDATPEQARILNNLLKQWNVNMLPHTRGSSLIDEVRISESENYFLACCVKADNMISAYVDDLLNVTCDRLISKYGPDGILAWCDQWEQ